MPSRSPRDAGGRVRSLASETVLMNTTRRRSLRPWFLAASLIGLGHLTVAAQEPFQGLDTYVNQALATWHVPGISIAIVRNDSVLYTKGYGVRAFGSPATVDDHTLFEIGSSSKAFTATIVAMLVGDGKMRWDAHVSDYLPGFRLYDPYASAELTVRDALTHRSGLARGELVWLGAGISRDEVLRRIRYLKPSWGFRSRFGYQNMMYLAAGEAAAKAAGTTWDDLVTKRIFEPLGMTSSVTSMPKDNGPNLASPHTASHDTVHTLARSSLEDIAPAGSINSNARDMAQWLRFQLGDGMYNGKRLVSSAALKVTHTPQTIIGPGELGPPDSLVTFNTYGMGWIVEDFRHELVWQHGGNTLGMTAAVGMMPEHKFGVVVLSNMAGSQLPGILMDYIFERQLGLPKRDISAEAYARYAVQLRRADSAEKAQLALRAPGGKPPFALSAYAATYSDSLYGDATVSVQDDHLVLSRGDWKGPLTYWNDENFRWSELGMFVKFEVAPTGTITGMTFGLPGDVSTMTRKQQRPTSAATRDALVPQKPGEKVLHAAEGHQPPAMQ
jgi:CubicO group peptidase (beta-lactamase class C family)